MRILFLLLTFSCFSFAQNENSKDLLNNNAPCTFELTIDQLVSNELSFNCTEVFGNKSFKIENFRIKFRDQPSIQVIGTALNFESKVIAENLKTGDVVHIFFIEHIILDNKKSQDFKTLKVKIVAEE
ncbi:hypothetical protein [Psychroserpens sp.]|uniref:hypothetical protein n=1 Tax=Psychroserpens sp. TaxID=2020870 RepID=UPI00385EFE07